MTLIPADTGRGAWYGQADEDCERQSRALRTTNWSLKSSAGSGSCQVKRSNRRNPENFIMSVAVSVIEGMKVFMSLFSKHLNSSGIKVLRF